MLRLKRIFKNYQETGSFNELVNLTDSLITNLLTKTARWASFSKSAEWITNVSTKDTRPVDQAPGIGVEAV